MDLTATHTRIARTHAQLLAGARGCGVVDAVRHVVALQAQDTRATRLAVRARAAGITRADVDAACADGSVVRTWAMRGTLHMLAADDVGWIVALLGPRFAASGRGRRKQLGLDDATCSRAAEQMRLLLAGKSLTRAEIMAALDFDAHGQAQAHLLSYAAMTGVIRRAADRSDDEPTYTVVEGSALADDKAAARLALRYIAAYGPATASDFAAWSGLPLTPARAAFADIGGQLHEVLADGAVAYVLGTPVTEGGPTVRLLGHFDTYLLGYRGRALAVPPEHDRRVQSGGGFIMPAVSVDGRVVGLWKHTWRKGDLVVSLDPFGRIPARLLPAIRAEVADIGRFLGVRAHLDE